MDGMLELEKTAPKESAVTETRSTTGPTPADIEAALKRFNKIVRARLRAHDLRRHGIDADDVEQDVRIRLWGALEREATRDLSGAYIQKVVLSAIIDAMRRERARRSEFGQDLEAVEATHADHGHQPDLLLAQSQWLEHLRQCVSHLPLRRQRPVRLHLLGYTMQELSDLSGLTLDSGSKLVRRGLAELRLLLGDRESDI